VTRISPHVRIARAGLSALLLGISACAGSGHVSSENYEPDYWSVFLDKLGSFSSPRVADLNADGVQDIVLGAGRLEFMATDSAVVALDGKSGMMLWNVRARDQIFGSAAFHDLNADGTLDVIIGGRSAVLLAIDGMHGSILWEYLPDSVSSREAGLYEFFNPQIIPDQDGDGVGELLTGRRGSSWSSAAGRAG